MAFKPKHPSLRPIIERLHLIAGMLRMGQRFTAGEIARHFEVSRKTITRDLSFLRDRMRYDFFWDPSASTYRLTSAPAAVL